MKILVAIANYGNGHRHYLERLIAAYRSMPWPVDIVVLSEAPKEVPEGVEVRVGLPDPSNPWSLPFAHRPLFAERQNQYDLFIYSEDDTLVQARNIEAFQAASAVLRRDEIPGFMRSEIDETGQMYVSSVHGFFRWLPSQVVTRADERFAAFSNEHSACYLATQGQLAVAMASGGFLVPPHHGRYDMLCAAATDIYTQCGLKRLIGIDRLRDFILPHLPNKYIGLMGVSIETVEAQVAELRRIQAANGWRGPLLEIESRLPFGTWSKDLYEEPDDQLLSMIPAGTKKLLSVGCGWGATEARLAQNGLDITAIPIDPVLADAVRRRGVRTLEGPLDEALSGLTEGEFDSILLADVLHLVDDPVVWLKRLRPYLTPARGSVVVSAPNTRDYLTLRAAVGGVRTAVSAPRNSGLNATSPRQLRKWLRAAGLTPNAIVPVLSKKRRMASNATLGALQSLLAQRFLGSASVGKASPV